MFIDNKKTTIGVKLKKRILILVLIIAVIIFFSFNFFRESFLGITGIGYTIILSGLIIIYHAWCIVRDYHYFYLSEQGAKLVFRFYLLLHSHQPEPGYEWIVQHDHASRD